MGVRIKAYKKGPSSTCQTAPFSSDIFPAIVDYGISFERAEQTHAAITKRKDVFR